MHEVTAHTDAIKYFASILGLGEQVHIYNIYDVTCTESVEEVKPLTIP